jgi:hypothetical protein
MAQHHYAFPVGTAFDMIVSHLTGINVQRSLRRAEGSRLLRRGFML